MQNDISFTRHSQIQPVNDVKKGILKQFINQNALLLLLRGEVALINGTILNTYCRSRAYRLLDTAPSSIGYCSWRRGWWKIFVKKEKCVGVSKKNGAISIYSPITQYLMLLSDSSWWKILAKKLARITENT